MKRLIPIAIILAFLFVLVPQPVYAATGVDYQVSASSDDCVRSQAYFSLTEKNMAGYNESSGSQERWGCGLRFQSIAVPQGAEISKAYLVLTCEVTTSGTTVNTCISAQDVDDAPPFSDVTNFDAKWGMQTTEVVGWDDIPAWTADRQYASPNIKSVVQEVVDREGWRSGNDIIIFWEDFDDRSTHDGACRRAAYSYDTNKAKAPKLYIEYKSYVYSGSDIDKIVDELDSEVDRLRSEVDELRSQVVELDSAISGLSGLEGRLKSSIQSSLSSFDEKLSSIDGKLNTSEKNVNALRVEVGALEAREDVSGRIRALEGRLGTVTWLSIVMLVLIAFLCVVVFALARRSR